MNGALPPPSRTSAHGGAPLAMAKDSLQSGAVLLLM
jgi:hypothetical protein